MKTGPMALCRQTSSPWLHQCARTSITTRHLSSTPSLLVVGPESPKWMELPRPIQPARPVPPPIKGVLPVPRNIIDSQKHKYKSSPQYFNRTAPPPKEQKWPSIDADRSDQLVYLQSMAATRRSNLREGLKGIHRRRVGQEKEDIFKRQVEKRANFEAKTRPDRPDELLTQQSVPAVVREALAWVPKPKQLSPEERAEKKAKYDACVEERMRFKMDCVHSLYMNAHKFIINEEQLNTRIEQAFGEDDNPVIWDGRSPNVWAVGNPIETSELVTRRGHTSNEDDREAMKKRMMQIAGALTGGKIKEPKAEDSHKLL